MASGQYTVGLGVSLISLHSVFHDQTMLWSSSVDTVTTFEIGVLENCVSGTESESEVEVSDPFFARIRCTSAPSARRNRPCCLSSRTPATSTTGTIGTSLPVACPRAFGEQASRRVDVPGKDNPQQQAAAASLQTKGSRVQDEFPDFHQRTFLFLCQITPGLVVCLQYVGGGDHSISQALCRTQVWDPLGSFLSFW